MKLLKKWNLFKTKYIKVFGDNNYSVTVDDIVEFINEFLGNTLHEAKEKENGESSSDEEESLAPVKTNKEKISEEDVKTLDEAVEAAKKSLESEEKDVLEEAAKKLTDAMMPIGAKLYESAEKTDDAKKEEGPVEGEVVDEEKKETK